MHKAWVKLEFRCIHPKHQQPCARLLTGHSTQQESAFRPNEKGKRNSVLATLEHATTLQQENECFNLFGQLLPKTLQQQKSQTVVSGVSTLQTLASKHNNGTCLTLKPLISPLMVSYSLLQHTSTVSMSSNTHKIPSPGARPPVDFFLLPSEAKMAAGVHHSVPLSQDTENSPNKEKVSQQKVSTVQTSRFP